MTQQEHLTTEQLSAYIDKQLTLPEQAFFDAHLQSCQRCQNALEEMRRTVALLHALPQPELPRSFTLPAGISHIQTVGPQPLPTSQRRAPRYMLQRTVRAVSTLAAVLAFIFIMSGLFANVHFGTGAGGSASTSAPVTSTFGNSNGTTHTEPNLTQEPRAAGSTPKAAATPVINGHQTRTPVVPTPTPTPQPTATPSNGGGTIPPGLPPLLDLGRPEGRLTLGTLLLLLSIVGIISSRRRRDTVS